MSAMCWGVESPWERIKREAATSGGRPRRRSSPGAECRGAGARRWTRRRSGAAGGRPPGGAASAKTSSRGRPPGGRPPPPRGTPRSPRSRGPRTLQLHLLRRLHQHTLPHHLMQSPHTYLKSFFSSNFHLFLNLYSFSIYFLWNIYFDLLFVTCV